MSATAPSELRVQERKGGGGHGYSQLCVRWDQNRAFHISNKDAWAWQWAQDTVGTKNGSLSWLSTGKRSFSWASQALLELEMGTGEEGGTALRQLWQPPGKQAQPVDPSPAMPCSQPSHLCKGPLSREARQRSPRPWSAGCPLTRRAGQWSVGSRRGRRVRLQAAAVGWSPTFLLLGEGGRGGW